MLVKEELLKQRGYQERHVVYFVNGHILRMYTKMLEESLTNYVDINGNPISIPGYGSLVCHHTVEQLQGNSLDLLQQLKQEEAQEESPVDKLKELKRKLKVK